LFKGWPKTHSMLSTSHQILIEELLCIVNKIFKLPKELVFLLIQIYLHQILYSLQIQTCE